MKIIKSDKIVGVKILKNEKESVQMTNVIENDNSMRIIEFKNTEEIDELIKRLKCFKNDFNKLLKYGPSLKGDE